MKIYILNTQFHSKQHHHGYKSYTITLPIHPNIQLRTILLFKTYFELNLFCIQFH